MGWVRICRCDAARMVAIPGEDVRSQLEALNYDPQYLEKDAESLVNALVRDVLVAKGGAAEAERQVERQVTDLRAALEKVRVYKSTRLLNN